MNRNQDLGTRTQGFRSLIAWQKADELASAVFKTMGSAKTDRWLISQTVRAAISVPANIAEGYGRGSIGDYTRFLDIARGSLSELEYYIIFLQREEIITASQADRLAEMQHETARLVHGLWKSLRSKAKDGSWDRTGTPQRDGSFYAVEQDSGRGT